jgi:hypothetical protein
LEAQRRNNNLQGEGKGKAEGKEAAAQTYEDQLRGMSFLRRGVHTPACAPIWNPHDGALPSDWKHSGTQTLASTTSSADVPRSGAVSVAHTDAPEEEQDEVEHHLMLQRSRAFLREHKGAFVGEHAGAFEGKLTVTVEMINVPDTGGWMERTDPFVRLTLGQETMRTSVKKNAGGNVIYRETCTFNKQLTHGKLRVAVMDKDTFVDDILGECTIDLHQMHIDGGLNRTEPAPFQVQIFQHCNKKKRNVVAVSISRDYVVCTSRIFTSSPVGARAIEANISYLLPLSPFSPVPRIS